MSDQSDLNGGELSDSEKYFASEGISDSEDVLYQAKEHLKSDEDLALGEEFNSADKFLDSKVDEEFFNTHEVCGHSDDRELLNLDNQSHPSILHLLPSADFIYLITFTGALASTFPSVIIRAIIVRALNHDLKTASSVICDEQQLAYDGPPFPIFRLQEIYRGTIHVTRHSLEFPGIWDRIYVAKMVQLVEVEDEHFQTPQAGPEEDDDFTDTGQFHACHFAPT